jgi:hypothetical protein
MTQKMERLGGRRRRVVIIKDAGYIRSKRTISTLEGAV